MEFNDDSVLVEVGELELVQGTEISCFANINNTNKKNVLFEFYAADSSKDFIALPYNYNNDTYTVPGEVRIQENELVIDDKFVINSNIQIPYKTNPKNKYVILGGKGKMLVTYKNTSNTLIADIPTAEKPFVATESCFLSFYVEGKGSIEYTFNKRPLHSNFSIQDGIIKIEKDIQKVFIDADEGFICYFNFSSDSSNS